MASMGEVRVTPGMGEVPVAQAESSGKVSCFSVSVLFSRNAKPDNQFRMGQAGKRFTQMVKITIKMYYDVPSLKAWHFALENKSNLIPNSASIFYQADRLDVYSSC